MNNPEVALHPLMNEPSLYTALEKEHSDMQHLLCEAVFNQEAEFGTGTGPKGKARMLESA